MTTTKTVQNISIIIPIHNEAICLSTQINKLILQLNQIKNLNFEIILIENGSKDNTYKIAKTLSSNNRKIKVIRLKDSSYGQAIKKGIAKSKYNYIIQFDIDFIDIFFLCQSMKLLKKYDITVGSKLHPKSNDNRPLIRTLVTITVNFFIRNFLKYQGTDTHGIKAYNKSSISRLITKIQSQHHFFDSELLIRAQYLSYKIKELPIHIKELRATRFPTSLRFWQSIGEMIQLIKLRQITFFNQNVIFHADDYGYSRKSNNEIKKLVEENQINTFSILPNFISTNDENNLHFLRSHRAAAHINLIEGRPVSPIANIKTLVNKDKKFFPLPVFLYRLFLGLIDKNEIRQEITAQVDLLKSLGINIYELNSHQHTHVFSPIAEIITSVAEKNGVKIRTYNNVVYLSLKAKITHLILHSLSKLSYLKEYGNLNLPITWKLSDGNRKCFMSWESKFYLLRKPQSKLKTITFIIHPGLPFDSNTAYQQYFSSHPYFLQHQR